MIKNLTKSRFKLSLDCNTKAYYDANRDLYANQSAHDEFLELLAFGGKQVGELAKIMYRRKDPSAIEIDSRFEEEQVSQTKKYLEKDKATLFEATLKYNNLLLRADILEKNGSTIDLIEVKATGWNPSEDSLLGNTSRSNPLNPAFEEYVYDITFQAYVTRLIYPHYHIRPWLLFLDTTMPICFDGLANLFLAVGQHNEKIILNNLLDIEKLAQFPFALLDVSEAVRIAQTTERARRGRQSLIFSDVLKNVSEALSLGIKPKPEISASCKSCSFYQSPLMESSLRSGWHECMSGIFDKTVIERKDSIFGFYGSVRYEEFVDQKVLAMKSLPSSANVSLHTEGGKIPLKLRQHLQYLESKGELNDLFYDSSTLENAFNSWKFPLHFIDFETSRSALPYFYGQRPYQQVLFQFSHHVIYEDGNVEHKTECLITEPRINPSLLVLEQLMRALKGDDGTVFHWFPHEKTVLREIHTEAGDKNVADLKEITSFLDSLGIHKESNGRLVDLGRFFDQFVYIPGTSGSSSMKKLLPAIFRNSKYLKEKYQSPIYGTHILPSFNFKNKVWYVLHDGILLNPYEQLGNRFNDSWINNNLKEIEALEGESYIQGVSDGASAVIAYNKLQQIDLDAQERIIMQTQLKRYCELDTLAMVMAYEAIRNR